MPLNHTICGDKLVRSQLLNANAWPYDSSVKPGYSYGYSNKAENRENHAGSSTLVRPQRLSKGYLGQRWPGENRVEYRLSL